jgi:hypothetical protein
MCPLQLSYLPFLSHSSTFWRKSQSTEGWPAKMQLDRALECRRRARSPAGLACAARKAPRRLGVRAGPVPTASRHEPPVPLHAGILGTLAASSYPVPRHTRPELPRGPSRGPLLSTPTEVRHRTEELWRAHPFVAKTGSRPAIKAARGTTRRPDDTVRHRRPTASSCLPTLPPPNKRLTAPHGPPTTSLCRMWHCRYRPLRRSEAPTATAAWCRRKPLLSASLPRPWAQIEPRWTPNLPPPFLSVF